MSVQVWKTYLCDSRYMTNKLVAETARGLVNSDQVSRANYKLILAVLMQKNGFMKISRLKSLCGSGKLSVPLLPHKGAWKCLVRLDQFALKRASAEATGHKASRTDQPVLASTSTSVKFVARIAGRKGKHEMVKQNVRPLLSQGTFQSLLEMLVLEANFSGLAEVLDLAQVELSLTEVDTKLSCALSSYKSGIEDNILHRILRDTTTTVSEKLKIFQILFLFESPKLLINKVNLNHESPLITAFGLGTASSGKQEWEKIANIFIKNGADVFLCDKKGLFYDPTLLGG